MDDSGDFVIAWHSQGQDDPGDATTGGIFAQLFDSAGNKQFTEFRVNATAPGEQTTPAIAMSADTDFTVAWAADGQDGDGLGVYQMQSAAR